MKETACIVANLLAASARTAPTLARYLGYHLEIQGLVRDRKR